MRIIKEKEISGFIARERVKFEENCLVNGDLGARVGLEAKKGLTVRGDIEVWRGLFAGSIQCDQLTIGAGSIEGAFIDELKSNALLVSESGLWVERDLITNYAYVNGSLEVKGDIKVRKLYCSGTIRCLKNIVCAEELRCERELNCEGIISAPKIIVGDEISYKECIVIEPILRNKDRKLYLSYYCLPELGIKPIGHINYNI